MSHIKAHRRLDLTRPTLTGEAGSAAPQEIADFSTDTGASTRAHQQESTSEATAQTSPALSATTGIGDFASNKREEKAPSRGRAPKNNSILKSAIYDGDAAAAASGTVVRVMAYLSEDEADLLDSLWLSLRRHEARPSKSDILRAALTSAAGDMEQLTNAMTRQRTSTLSRQRSSKMR